MSEQAKVQLLEEEERREVLKARELKNFRLRTKQKEENEKARASLKEEALAYHAAGGAGKYTITATKPMNSAKDLSLAYSPGVAEPCLEIQKDA